MPKKKKEKKKDIYLRTLLNSLNAFLSVGKTTDETDRAVSIGLNLSKYTCVYQLYYRLIHEMNFYITD